MDARSSPGSTVGASCLGWTAVYTNIPASWTFPVPSPHGTPPQARRWLPSACRGSSYHLHVPGQGGTWNRAEPWSRQNVTQGSPAQRRWPDVETASGAGLGPAARGASVPGPRAEPCPGPHLASTHVPTQRDTRTRHRGRAQLQRPPGGTHTCGMNSATVLALQGPGDCVHAPTGRCSWEAVWLISWVFGDGCLTARCWTGSRPHGALRWCLPLCAEPSLLPASPCGTLPAAVSVQQGPLPQQCAGQACVPASSRAWPQSRYHHPPGQAGPSLSCRMGLRPRSETERPVGCSGGHGGPGSGGVGRAATSTWRGWAGTSGAGTGDPALSCW